MFQTLKPLLEPIAVLCGLMSVWFSKERSILVYPIGLISVTIYIYLCYINGIYADMWINVFYFIMSIYGWWVWHDKKDIESKVEVETCSRLTNVLWIAFALPIWYGIYWVLTEFTNSTIPIMDSFTTAGSIVGMILMAQRKIENWLYWIVVDAVLVPMFAYKGLNLTAFQFSLFCLLALSGYLSWYKILRDEKSSSN